MLAVLLTNQIGFLPVLIALFHDPVDAVWVLAFITLYQQFENLVLSPRITARTMSLHPAVAFGAVIAGGAILGPIGALLALPAAASIQALVQYNNQSALITSNIRLALLNRSGTGLPCA